MAVTPKVLIAPAQLTVSAATYYTVPANTTTIIKKLTFTNTSGTARTVTVYFIPSGGSASDTNTLTKTQSIPATSVWECYEAEGHTLGAGDFIQALADGATAVSVRASGLEVV